jgi:hypothetical protein
VALGKKEKGLQGLLLLATLTEKLPLYNNTLCYMALFDQV